MYAQTLQHQQGQGGPAAAGVGGGVYETAGRQQSAGHGAGAESIYGKKSDYYAPRPPLAHPSGTGPLSSSHLPPPPLPPTNNNNRQQPNQSQLPPPQQQVARDNSKIYYPPPQQMSQNYAAAGGRYQTPPQAIPGPSASHYSINQKIYMSPTNPFLSSSTVSPPQQQSQGIYGERQPPPPSPRHAPPAVPQRSYLQQYHAQNQMDHSSASPSHSHPNSPPNYGQTGGNQIAPPQYLYQRPQPPGTKFVNSPIYNSVGHGGAGGGPSQGGVPINVAYHGGGGGGQSGSATSPPSSSLSPSNMINHPSKYTSVLFGFLRTSLASFS